MATHTCSVATLRCVSRASAEASTRTLPLANRRRRILTTAANNYLNALYTLSNLLYLQVTKITELLESCNCLVDEAFFVCYSCPHFKSHTQILQKGSILVSRSRINVLLDTDLNFWFYFHLRQNSIKRNIKS